MTTDAGAAGAPRFDVVLRGYDRRQVDEHVARLQRVISRMRADLDLARSQPFPVVSPSGGFPGAGGPGRPRPAPHPRPGGPAAHDGSPDMIGSFTDRMQSILQAAEEEAAEIRNAARHSARADTDAARAELADLARQRDAVRSELTRLRGQLESMLAAPTTRIVLGQPGSPGTPTGAGPRPGPGPAHPPAAPAEPRDQHGAPKPSPRSTEQSTTVVRAVGPAAPSRQPDDGRRSGGPGGQPAGPGSRPAAPADRAADAATRAAHRMPTGSYPAVGEPTSMRPRTEPEPEPGELFRPVVDTGSRQATESRTTVVRLDADRTTAVPPVRPSAAGSDKPATGQARPPAEATVKVGAVRPVPAAAGQQPAAAETAKPTAKSTDEPESNGRKDRPDAVSLPHRSTSGSRSG